MNLDEQHTGHNSYHLHYRTEYGSAPAIFETCDYHYGNIVMSERIICLYKGKYDF